MDYTTPEKIAETYRKITSASAGALQIAQNARACLDRSGAKLHISFDEWNFWYAWYRPSCVGEGIFTAKMLHMLIRESNPLDMPVCCYFQPVGEGAILIESDSARLTANGQMFAAMKAHCGGDFCALTGDDDGSTVATVKDGILTVTLINDSYDSERRFIFNRCGEPEEAVLYTSDEVVPYSYFTEMPLTVETEGQETAVTLPPHSVAKLIIRLPG